MGELEKQKIKQFLADKAMCEAVYKALLDEFLNEKIIHDVQVLASSRLAMEHLKQAFKRLERHNKQDKEIKDTEIIHV